MPYAIDLSPPNPFRGTFLLVAQCLTTGRIAALHTPKKPKDADWSAVLRKLREG